MTARTTLLDQVRHALIVSCQALPGEPLHGSHIMTAMALAAEMGGARGLRANSPADVRAIKAGSRLPVIGLHKVDYLDSPIYITPTLTEIRAIAAAGADMIAVDATRRRRPGGENFADLVAKARAELDISILADVSTLNEGLAAAAAGADAISTTMSGYTDYSPQLDGPDFALLAALVERSPVPVIAEGRIWSPEEARRALELGAHAVVVGSAITRPQTVVARYVSFMQSGAPNH
ncbi:MAG TPA: N-acetylmannosamine-6-phosphate 2-epimerase [Symbiobacteriaceae bacterium]|nr:N-acetylmannosamine-6-phosphate 2-epimerase [Symbiobacteriaceae bacterium]